MRVLVLGANGATGKQVVMQLIKRQINTRILIRKKAVLSKDIQENPLVEVVKGDINELNDSEMNNLLRDCNVIISCLGHNVTLKGMFGNPRYLVFDAIKRISETVKNKADKRVKLILMSTTAYTNTLSREKNSMVENIILSLLKLLLPPHRDNVKAADYLITKIGKEDENIGWIAVRPDTLVNNDEESSYQVCESPVRSPIFNARKTSRINVSHFMAELVTDDTIWKYWQFKTPVVYNK
ncbi:NAD(P)-binding oxidoreductase [Pseudalkalibacillus sp. R45]|uniref:NAD(P)-binding oxidoreductase n=1 Tax=Pseudalkalibacillus sp. R45 TaxID=3457433 RepID=UPI003FCE2443